MYYGDSIHVTLPLLIIGRCLIQIHNLSGGFLATLQCILRKS